jgi:hypothetical protein
VNVKVHRDEEIFFFKNVEVVGPLPHGIETQIETSIPFFIAVMVRHRLRKQVIMNELVKKK